MPTPQCLLMTLSSVHILLAHYTSCSHQPVSSSLPCSEPHALSWGAPVAGSPLEASGWKGGVKGVSRGFCPPLPTRRALGQWLLLSAWSHSYGSDPSFQLPSSLGFGHNVTSVPSASCSCLVLGTSGSFCLPLPIFTSLLLLDDTPLYHICFTVWKTSPSSLWPSPDSS